MVNVFDNLNTKQKEAVVKTERKIRVTAGAGSGKTRVLTQDGSLIRFDSMEMIRN